MNDNSGAGSAGFFLVIVVFLGYFVMKKAIKVTIEALQISYTFFSFVAKDMYQITCRLARKMKHAPQVETR